MERKGVSLDEGRSWSCNEVPAEASANTVGTFANGMTHQCCPRLTGAGLVLFPCIDQDVSPGKGWTLGALALSVVQAIPEGIWQLRAASLLKWNLYLIVYVSILSSFCLKLLNDLPGALRKCSNSVTWSSKLCMVWPLLDLSSFSSVQFSRSVISDSLGSMNRSTPGLPVHHQLPESTQTHVH